MTDQTETAPIRKGLLPCIPPPEWEFHTVYGARSDSEGCALFPGDTGPVVVRRRVTYGDWEPVRPGRWADEPPADVAPAVPAGQAPDTGRAGLRQQIAHTLAAADGWTWATGFDAGKSTVYQGYLSRVDAVLAALPAPADRAAVYREVADRLAADAEQGDKEGFTRIYRRSAAFKVREWAAAPAVVSAVPGQTDGEALLELVRDFLDPDPCSFDHHGYCQAHGYLGGEPGSCPHGRARKLLAAIDEQPAAAQQSEVVHACPAEGSNTTRCCNRMLYELPATEPTTADPASVTCKPAAGAQQPKEA